MTGPHSKDDYLLCSVQCFDLLQFELVDSFDESYVQCIHWG